MYFKAFFVKKKFIKTLKIDIKNLRKTLLKYNISYGFLFAFTMELERHLCCGIHRKTNTQFDERRLFGDFETCKDHVVLPKDHWDSYIFLFR